MLLCTVLEYTVTQMGRHQPQQTTVNVTNGKIQKRFYTSCAGWGSHRFRVESLKHCFVSYSISWVVYLYEYSRDRTRIARFAPQTPLPTSHLEGPDLYFKNKGHMHSHLKQEDQNFKTNETHRQPLSQKENK